jgi:dCTP deaminase
MGLSNVAKVPITLYSGMKIGQISFLRLTTAAERLYGDKSLGSRYQGQTETTASRFYQDFENKSN